MDNVYVTDILDNFEFLSSIGVVHEIGGRAYKFGLEDTRVVLKVSDGGYFTNASPSVVYEFDKFVTLVKAGGGEVGQELKRLMINAL